MTSPPLPIIPRLDPKPWGGRRLARYGFALPAGVPIGEAVISGDDARIASGPLAGRTLGEIIAADPAATLGPRALAATGGRATFPVLVKLIDAAEVLSVQVHPDDAAAARQTGGLGKTEAWHVLDAEPGALLHLGLRDDARLAGVASLARAGRTTGHLLREVAATPGDTILLPAGAIHAVGAGALVYEVQQQSATTWRLDDWGRVGSDGAPRELHVEQALAVADERLRPTPTHPVELPPGSGRWLLVACHFFALERIEAPAGGAFACASDAPQVITCLRGAITVATAAGACELAAGASAAVFADARDCRILAGAGSVALRSWLPDLAADLVAPARASGVPLTEVVALAAPLSDIRDAAGA